MKGLSKSRFDKTFAGEDATSHELARMVSYVLER